MSALATSVLSSEWHPTTEDSSKTSLESQRRFMPWRKIRGFGGYRRPKFLRCSKRGKDDSTAVGNANRPWRLQYRLVNDASEFAIDAVLSQLQGGFERVIAYASRSLDRRKQNYCVTRKELLVVVGYFKQYLLDRCFHVRMDHPCTAQPYASDESDGEMARADEGIRLHRGISTRDFVTATQMAPLSKQELCHCT